MKSLIVLNLRSCASPLWNTGTIYIAVLDRVRAFLPITDEAGRKLMADIGERGQQEFDMEAVSANGAEPHIRDGICNKTLLSSPNTHCYHLLRHKKFSNPNVCLRMRSLANSTFKLPAVAIKDLPFSSSAN